MIIMQERGDGRGQKEEGRRKEEGKIPIIEALLGF